MRRIYVDEELKKLDKLLDYEKIRKVMHMLDWKWFQNGSMQVPMISDLSDQAHRLLKTVLEKWNKNNKSYFISTGGFQAQVDENGLWQVSFQLTDADNYDDNYDEKTQYNMLLF